MFGRLDNLLADALEDLGALRSEFGEDLTVETETELLQLRDEGAVGLVSARANSGVQADNPKLAEGGLLITTVGEGVATGTHKGFVSEV